MKKHFNRISSKIYWIYLLTFGLMLALIGFVLFTGIRTEMTKQLGNARVDVLKQIGEQVRSINNSTITISNLYRYDDQVEQILNGAPTSEEIAATKAYLDKEKEGYDTAFADIGIQYEIIIIGENEFRYVSEETTKYDYRLLEKQLWYRGCFSRGNELEFISSFRDSFGSNPESVVFGIFRNIYGKDGKRLGTLIVKVEERMLFQLYDNILGADNYIYIIDEKGNIVSDPQKERLGLNFINVDYFQKIYQEKPYTIISKLGKKILLSHYRDEQTGWTIIEEIPWSVLFRPLYNFLGIVGAALLVCVCGAVAVSRSASKSISQPLLLLCDTMNQVKRGNLDVISNIKGYEEIELLKNSFNDMSCTIRSLLEEIQVKEKNKREMELDFLRLQINPHFLYNTLFSIQCLIETDRNDEALYMMSAFITHLRGTLSVSDQYISVEEEIRNVEKYLILQQLRYRDKVYYEIDMEEDSKCCFIPSFLLQPIVENAIFHGIEGKEDSGMIVVESQIEEDTLYLCVSDDGNGMTEEERRVLLAELQKGRKDKTDSIGMSNVSERIRLNFGEEYGLKIESVKGFGTKVILKLPIVRGVL